MKAKVYPCERMNVDHIPQLIPDIARIVIGYAEVLKHPLKTGCCAVCGTPAKGYTSLCPQHQDICALCLNFRKVDAFHACESCTVRYDTDSWLLTAMGIVNGDIFTALYRDDESPIDMEFLISQSGIFDSLGDLAKPLREIPNSCIIRKSAK